MSRLITKKIITKHKILTSLMLVSILGATGCSQLEKIPVQNPFKSQASIKLGPLPEVAEAQKGERTQVVHQWNYHLARLAGLASGASIYPKILPVVDGDIIYQAHHKGQLIALNRKTGKKYWQVKTPYAIASGPTVTQSSLLIGTSDAKVIALDKKTGAKQWVSVLSSEVLAPPKGNDNRVVVNTIDGKMTGLNAQTGDVVWSHDCAIPSLILRGSSTPQLAGDYALSGFANGKLVALQVNSGSLAWENVIASPQGASELHRMVDIKADPVIDGESVFVATFQGKLAKLSLHNGENQWQREISVHHNIRTDDDAIYLTDANDHLWALDKATGQTLWTQASLSKRAITAPSLIGEYVMVGDRGGYVHWLDKKTGQLKGQHRVGNKIVSDLIVDADRVLVSTQNGNLAVFKFKVS